MAKQKKAVTVTFDPFSKIVKAGKNKTTKTKAPMLPSLPEPMPGKNKVKSSNKKMKIKSQPKLKKKLNIEDLM